MRGLAIMTNVVAVLFLGFFIGHLFHSWRRDTTDAPGSRSGLILYRDHATGVQYVTAGAGFFFGNLTPRIGADGKPYAGE